jgi:hypothetical protein
LTVSAGWRRPHAARLTQQLTMVRAASSVGGASFAPRIRTYVTVGKPVSAGSGLDAYGATASKARKRY